MKKIRSIHQVSSVMHLSEMVFRGSIARCARRSSSLCMRLGGQSGSTWESPTPPSRVREHQMLSVIRSSTVVLRVYAWLIARPSPRETAVAPPARPTYAANVAHVCALHRFLELVDLQWLRPVLGALSPYVPVYVLSAAVVGVRRRKLQVRGRRAG